MVFVLDALGQPLIGMPCTEKRARLLRERAVPWWSGSILSQSGQKDRLIADSELLAFGIKV
jgi:hypothetical protein